MDWSGNLIQGSGAAVATDLHPAEPVKGYAGDANPPQLRGVAVAAAPGTFVALLACHLPPAEVLVDHWSLSGSDLWTVLVVDCGLHSDV